MTSDHRPRRTQIVPGWADRAWVWATGATDGIAWLIGVCLFVAGLGFVFFPVDLHDRNQARALQPAGDWATAQEVQVHVDYVSGRGGGYFEVDEVRVHLSGSRNPIDLEDVNAEANSVDGDVREGWQNPSSVTGYEPPLTVRVQRNDDGSVVTAMAKDDYDYWTEDNHDPEFGLMLGFGGLAVTVLVLILNSLRLNWQDKRGRLHHAKHDAALRTRVAATGKRSSR